MREGELATFAAVLNLSEAQRAAVSAMYEDYLEQFQTIAPRIEALSQRERERSLTGVYTGGEYIEYPPRTRRELYEAAKDIVADARRLEPEMVRLEEQFFNRLSSILAEPQLEWMHRVELERRRVRYQVRTSALPGAQVDLIAMIRSLEDHFEENDAVAAILAAYLDRLTLLLRVRHDAQRRVHVGDLRWLVEVEGKAIDSAALDARGRIRSPQMRAEARIRHLNMSTLEALTTAVDADTATALRNTFFELAHPSSRWWPDPLEQQTRALLREALSRDDLDEDAASELEYLQEMFSAGYHRLQRRLSDADFNHRERVERTLSSHVDDIATYEAEVRNVLAEREQLCERTTRSVEQLLLLYEVQ